MAGKKTARAARKRTRQNVTKAAKTAPAGGAPKKEKAAPYDFFQSRMPYLIVFVCCVLLAVYFGIHVADFWFQKSVSQSVSLSGCDYTTYAPPAFAKDNRMLLPLPHGEKVWGRTVFLGSGEADRILVRFDEPDLNLTRLEINGQVICAPCERGGAYNLQFPIAGRLEINSELEEVNGALGEAGEKHLAFFENVYPDRIFAPLELVAKGSWHADVNAKMPSSFYGVDAPFHISRIPILAESLRNLHWPWSSYSFVSVLPPTLFHMATGATPQYSFKVYEILVFFIPIILFYLFSRKLKSGRGGAFLFASLLYFFLPTVGYVTGGAADLFMYGMLPHTLATYLSLFFLFFSYESVFEAKRGSSFFAIAAFALAYFCNMRILLALGFLSVSLLVAAYFYRRFWRSVILLSACVLSVAWAAVPALTVVDYAGYPTLSGIKIEAIEQGAIAALQAGYLILPLLFLFGAYYAFRKRNVLSLLLVGSSVVIFAFTTNPLVNSLLPFVDGLRFMPSFFLPAFFIAGVGIREVFFALIGIAKDAGKRMRMDVDTFAVCVGLALLLPSGIFVLASMTASSITYIWEASSLSAAWDYSVVCPAFGSANGPIVYLSRGESSQFMLCDGWMDQSVRTGDLDGAKLYEQMKEIGAATAIVGNTLYLDAPANHSRFDDYLGVASEPKLTVQLLLDGSAVVIRTDATSGNRKYYAEGVRMDYADVRHDSASFSGECVSDRCRIVLFNSIPPSVVCQNTYGSCLIVSTEGGLREISEVASGRFEILVEPVHQEYEYLLFALGMAAVACALFFPDPYCFFRKGRN